MGIGDTIWHIPYLRAIAAASRDGKATLVCRPATHAKELLRYDDCVEEVPFLKMRGAKRVGQLLKQHRDDAYLSQKLTRIHREVPMQACPESLARREVDVDALADFCEGAGFGLGLQRRCINLCRD